VKPKKQIRVAIVDHKQRMSSLQDLKGQIEEGIKGIIVDVFDGSIKEFDPDTMKDYIVVFYHGEQWEALEQIAKSHKVVIVRMYSAGHTRGTDENTAKRNAFVLRRPLSPDSECAMQTQDWIKVLPILTDSKCVTELQRGDNPGSVREYFFDILPFFLEALAIKLQAFLVVHWTAQKWPRGKQKQNIKDAVDKTGWLDLKRDEQIILCKNPKKKCKEVRDAESWSALRQFLQKRHWKSEDVKNNEWSPFGSTHLPWAKDVEKVIQTILDEKPMENVKLVANAYCEISKRLSVSC
jgi:hypothetical protein